MFDRFTDRARKIMSLAKSEAQRLNHEYIGTEHILLGLIQEGSGVAANVLRSMGVGLERVRAEVELLVTGSATMVPMGNLPFTPRAKKVLEFAFDEAQGLEHDYIGTEHVLLGLLRENEGIAARVLTKLNVRLEELREEVLEFLGAPLQGDEPFKRSTQAAPEMPSAAAWQRRPRVRHAAILEADWARGDGPPLFERLKSQTLLLGERVRVQRGTALALVSSGEASERLYESVIAPALQRDGVTLERSDRLAREQPALARVWAALRQAEIIVADVSDRDPQVMLLLGMALAVGRWPIVLDRLGTEPSERLDDFECLYYDTSDEGVEAMRRELSETVEMYASIWRHIRGSAEGGRPRP